MKFRTDFVTNSSSSSFVDCWINFKDSSSYEIYVQDERHGDEVLYNLGYFEISTMDDLLACLYFSRSVGDLFRNCSSSITPVLSNIFQFLADKKTFVETIDNIKNYISEDFSERPKPDWADDSEILELLDIDSDEYDHDELIDKVLELFGEFFTEELYIDDDLIDLAREDRPLSDVYSLCFSEEEHKYGEFLNGYIEELYEKFGENKAKSLHKISKDDPLYVKEKNKWECLVSHLIHQHTRGKVVEDYLHLNIDRGLELGEYKFLIDSVTVETKEERFFDDALGTSVISKDQKEKKENAGESIDYLTPRDLPEKDFYFRLYHCIDQNDIQTMRSLFEIHHIEKHFSEYPVTDLLAMAMERDYKEYTNLLLQSDLELDYTDVAHYIFNNNLETLYPLFDRGLKIEASAYEDLITYASEQGKPEYTAWLLNWKNEAVQDKSTIE